MKTQKRNRGMTLMELLTVIAIIGMMAAITLPAFHLMARGSRLNNAARLITETLSAARGLAIAQRRSYYVEYDDEIAIDPEKNRIRIFYDEDGGTLEANGSDRRTVGEWQYLPEPIVFFDGDVDMGSDFRYKYPDDYVKFKANGGAVGATTSQPWKFTIVDKTTLEDAPYTQGKLKEAKTCRVYVINVTGRIKAVIE